MELIINFDELTAEQIIKKYEQVLHSRENQLFELSAEVGKVNQKLENLKEKFENESYRPVEFIQFLVKKICAHTSLENLDLNDEQNKGEYIDLICGVSFFLMRRPHKMTIAQFAHKHYLLRSFQGQPAD